MKLGSRPLRKEQWPLVSEGGWGQWCCFSKGWTTKPQTVFRSCHEKDHSCWGDAASWGDARRSHKTPRGSPRQTGRSKLLLPSATVPPGADPSSKELGKSRKVVCRAGSMLGVTKQSMGE